MFCSFLVVLFLCGRADGYSLYRWQTCHTSNLDLSDLVFVDNTYFNRIKLIVFNSTVGKFVGYTEVGERIAKQYNNDEAYLSYVKNTVNRYCKPAALLYNTYSLNLTSEPIVKLNLQRSASESHPAMLVCSAYNFYPKLIRVTWYRDGQKVTSDVSATEELADGDWFYQIHSHLEFNPKSGEKISCMVEHAFFKEPREFSWDSSILEAERNKVATGAAGLVLGLVVCAAGLLYYRKKTQGWILVPPR